MTPFSTLKNVGTLPTRTAGMKSPQNSSNVDPDDLFVRLTLLEIRNIQTKLRTDADAKQEDLRLMVGERYRDLLQASTSIISIASSSKRVTSTLDEMREIMTSDESEQKPRRSSVRGNDDTHLKTMQSLAAHLKLLLDAPEHLWRLLERKKYLPAAWLFLLARVVHRALVTDDPEESWEREGISVSMHFPLVQRQWDVIAQFRSQIVHRATQYLRETSISSESTCSTVLTLHLLDSLPLSETISTLLSQRTRTLNALLGQKPDRRSLSRPVSPFSKSTWKTREAADKSIPETSVEKPAQCRKDAVKTVRFAVLELLDVIIGTVCIARDVFRPEDNKKSRIEDALERIHTETTSNPVLTTPSLLSTLPSSTHLLTLPQSILSYKPYIDLTSPSTQIEAVVVDTKIFSWFDKVTRALAERLDTWFESLATIREVWRVRRKVLQRLEASQGLEERERVRIHAILDSSVKNRASEVAQTALKDVVETLGDALRKVVQDVGDESEGSRLDVIPSAFFMSPPPIPSMPQLGSNPGFATTSFKSFKNALQQRAICRTPSLDKFLNDIESKARELEEDLEVMDKDDRTSRELRQQVMAIHYPAAQSSLKKIIENLERLCSPENTDMEGTFEKHIFVVTFLGRICHSMVSSSFGRSVCCQGDTLQDFRDNLSVLHERSLAQWRKYAVSEALKKCTPLMSAPSTASVARDIVWPSQPSSRLISALLSIGSSLQRLGLSHIDLHSKRVSTNVMHDFKAAYANEFPVDGLEWGQEQVQLLFDLTFLQRLPHIQSGDSEYVNDTEDVLSSKAERLRSRLRSTREETFSEISVHIESAIDHYLLRCRTLLAPLSLAPPSKSTPVDGNAVELHSGSKVTVLPWTPTPEQDFMPAIDIAKPSARFGLVLVGSTMS